VNDRNSPLAPGNESHDVVEASQIPDNLSNALWRAKPPKCGFGPHRAAKRPPLEAPGGTSVSLMLSDSRKALAHESQTKSLLRLSKHLLSVLLLALVLSGCATRPKPNEPQKWGIMAYMPWTASHSARVAEQVKQPRIDEAARKNVNIIVETLQAVTNRTWPQELALASAKQAQREIGLPNKPLAMGSLLSTNPVTRAKGLKELEKDFRKEDKDLADVRQASEAAAKRGAADIKQGSWASVIWWEIETRVKNFINGHWFALLLSFTSVAFIALKVLPILFPYMGAIFGTITRFVAGLFRIIKGLFQFDNRAAPNSRADSASVPRQTNTPEPSSGQEPPSKIVQVNER